MLVKEGGLVQILVPAWQQRPTRQSDHTLTQTGRNHQRMKAHRAKHPLRTWLLAGLDLRLVESGASGLEHGLVAGLEHETGEAASSE